MQIGTLHSSITTVMKRKTSTASGDSDNAHRWISVLDRHGANAAPACDPSESRDPIPRKTRAEGGTNTVSVTGCHRRHRSAENSHGDKFGVIESAVAHAVLIWSLVRLGALDVGVL